MTSRKKPLRAYGRRRWPMQRAKAFGYLMNGQASPFYIHPTKGWRAKASLRWAVGR